MSIILETAGINGGNATAVHVVNSGETYIISPNVNLTSNVATFVADVATEVFNYGGILSQSQNQVTLYLAEGGRIFVAAPRS